RWRTQPAAGRRRRRQGVGSASANYADSRLPPLPQKIYRFMRIKRLTISGGAGRLAPSIETGRGTGPTTPGQPDGARQTWPGQVAVFLRGANSCGDLSVHRKMVAIRPVSPRGGGGNFRHCPARLDGPSQTGTALSPAIAAACEPFVPSAPEPAGDARRGTLACSLDLRHAGRRQVQ